MLASKNTAAEKPANASPEAGGRAGQKARTRARIIAAATTLLDGNDGADFTARGVAARAGVSAGLVLQHFETLADLALEVFVKLNTDSSANFPQAAEGYGDPVDRTFAAFAALLERDLARRALTGRVMAFAWTWTPHHEERLQETVEVIAEAIIAMLVDPDRPTTREARRAAAGALLTIYNGYLRVAVAHDEDAEAGLARMRAPMTHVLNGLYAGGAS